MLPRLKKVAFLPLFGFSIALTGAAHEPGFPRDGALQQAGDICGRSAPGGQPSVDVVVYQTACNAPLVAGKPALVRVYVSWLPELAGKQRPKGFSGELVLEDDQGNTVAKADGYFRNAADPAFATREVKSAMGHTINLAWTPTLGVKSLKATVTPAQDAPFPGSIEPGVRAVTFMRSTWMLQGKVYFAKVRALNSDGWSDEISQEDWDRYGRELRSALRFAVQLHPVLDIETLGWYQLHVSQPGPIAGDYTYEGVETKTWLGRKTAASDDATDLTLVVVPPGYSAPDAPAVTVTPGAVFSDPIDRATIVISADALYSATVAHELGHYLGLGSEYHERDDQPIEGVRVSTDFMNKSDIEGDGESENAVRAPIELMLHRGELTTREQAFIPNAQYALEQKHLDQLGGSTSLNSLIKVVANETAPPGTFLRTRFTRASGPHSDWPGLGTGERTPQPFGPNASLPPPVTQDRSFAPALAVRWVRPLQGGVVSPGDTLEWSGDAAGGSTYTVSYSPDGQDWSLLGVGLTTQRIVLPAYRGLRAGPQPTLVVTATGATSASSDTIRIDVSTEPSPLHVLPGPGDTVGSAEIQVHFTADLDSAAVVNRFRVDGPGGPVPGRVSYDPTNDRLEYVPDAPGHPGASYSVSLDAGIQDMYGNRLTTPYTWSFVMAPDTIAPRITSTFPFDGGLSLPQSVTPRVRFSEAMDTLTLRGAGLTLVDARGATVSGAVRWDANRNEATLVPDAALVRDEVYTVEVSRQVSDRFGNLLEGGARFSFQVVNAAGPRRP